jgi:hypothetical protein
MGERKPPRRFFCVPDPPVLLCFWFYWWDVRPNRGRSRLAGAWYVAEGTMSIVREDGTTEERTYHLTGDAPDLIIREDGSFDWSITRHVKPDPVLSDLRKAGDSVCPEDGSGKRAKFEVTASRFTMTSSYAVFHCYLPGWDDVLISREVKTGVWSRFPQYREVRSHPGRKGQIIHAGVLHRYEGELPNTDRATPRTLPSRGRAR